ncbi:regulatory protein RecX [Microbacterium sp. ISL-59]|uniref:regulatory protein RecX n=1 Tax=Microbacterium sp. ISL-59 TaxID=2819159 RepID=UPI001BEBAD24|nr:regulatory protein RecX [Microbacterium sp. ISL-59]MBT2494351.1 regulatory protein RecX [Microbacterium sp. ISL-59]
MNDTRGGDPDRIAPIIPLFGRAAKDVDPVSISPGTDDDISGDRSDRSDGADLWRPTWGAGASPAESAAESGSPSDRHPARGASARSGSPASRSAPRLHALGAPPASQGDTADPSVPDEARSAAEESLVRKLRTRSLSISEARQALRGHGLENGVIDEVIEDFCRRAYLDDAALASALVTSGVERKGQGRVALARTLAQRGIPRDVVDAALDELPDDDDERALEFARTKARSLSRLDNDTALRRLVGQLSRRGYNGSVAMKAAKQALRETGPSASSSGVRFVDSD